jgi:transposase-like protein
MSKSARSSVEKLKLVLESMERNVVITQFCRHHNISRSSLYRWRKMLQDGLCILFSSKKGEQIRKPVTPTRPKCYRCRLK